MCDSVFESLLVPAQHSRGIFWETAGCLGGEKKETEILLTRNTRISHGFIETLHKKHIKHMRHWIYEGWVSLNDGAFWDTGSLLTNTKRY